MAAGELVTVPLITAILARWVLRAVAASAIGAVDLLASALEAFPAVLLVVVVWLTVSPPGSSR